MDPWRQLARALAVDDGALVVKHVQLVGEEVFELGDSAGGARLPLEAELLAGGALRAEEMGSGGQRGG